jgi:hypothetical protein
MIPGWKEDIGGPFLDFVRQNRSVTPSEVAERFKISESSAVYWLTDLVRDGRLRFTGLEVVEEDELEEARQNPQPVRGSQPRLLHPNPDSTQGFQEAA